MHGLGNKFPLSDESIEPFSLFQALAVKNITSRARFRAIAATAWMQCLVSDFTRSSLTKNSKMYFW